MIFSSKSLREAMGRALAQANGARVKCARIKGEWVVTI